MGTSPTAGDLCTARSLAASTPRPRIPGHAGPCAANPLSWPTKKPGRSSSSTPATATVPGRSRSRTDPDSFHSPPSLASVHRRTSASSAARSPPTPLSALQTPDRNLDALPKARRVLVRDIKDRQGPGSGFILARGAGSPTGSGRAFVSFLISRRYSRKGALSPRGCPSGCLGLGGRPAWLKPGERQARHPVPGPLRR